MNWISFLNGVLLKSSSFLNHSLINVKSNLIKFCRSTSCNVLQYRLLIGNPGVGKSTLANCIAKTDLFKSGIKIGNGMTCQLDEKIHNKITYLDTPGLSDVSMRKAAANAITEGLKKGGWYQIFFVITLEAGRILAEDLATIKLVLDNATDIISYSLIINKLSKRAYDNLITDGGKGLKKNLSELEFQVGKNRKPPKALLLLSDNILNDAENKFINLDRLDGFVQKAPRVYVNPNNVKEISGDHKSFEDCVISVLKKLNHLRNDKEAMLKQCKATEERYKNLYEKKVEFLIFTFLIS